MLFSKYNAPQFSKLFKGSWISSLRPAARGRLNRILNMGIENINGRTATGNAAFTGANQINNLTTDKK